MVAPNYYIHTRVRDEIHNSYLHDRDIVINCKLFFYSETENPILYLGFALLYLGYIGGGDYPAFFGLISFCYYLLQGIDSIILLCIFSLFHRKCEHSTVS